MPMTVIREIASGADSRSATTEPRTPGGRICPAGHASPTTGPTSRRPCGR